ncbi:MAG: hypothetical protein GXO78_09480 [Calditrichaeota bacterium]|nr:hypothetical protein [Calditrichota bacterium]
MKMLRYGLVLLLGALVFLFVWQQGGRARGSGPFRLVSKTAFKSPVKQWWFLKTGDVALTDGELIWIRATGERETLPLPERTVDVQFSPEGRFYAVVRVLDERVAPGKQQEGRIQLHRLGEEPQFVVPFHRAYDEGFPQVAVSDQGSLIVVRGSTAELEVYNPAGRRVFAAPLFSDASYDLERKVAVQPVPDDGRMFVAITRHGMTEKGANPFLILLSMDGKENWRQALPAHGFTRLVVSPNGRYAAVGIYRIGPDRVFHRRTVVYDDSGNEVAESDLLMKFGRFSPDARYVLLAENQRAGLLDLSSGQSVWTYDLPEGSAPIAAIDLSEMGKKAALLIARSEFEENTFQFVNPRLLVLDEQGMVAQELDFNGQRLLTPALRLSATGQELFIGFQQEKQTFRVR